ncbi:hypothetical protein WJX73_009414 [Symbiochloris irregularis]|uniref:Uncharacterized protein n=1 Tax=Symbiochloris irregularis TaxID=706552 RepID=A0AAW1NUZ7_9CHLO
MRKPLQLYQVDAFAERPFEGNPAAVCLLENEDLPMNDGLRQQIAAEQNLSETAFLEVLSQQGTSNQNDQDLNFQTAGEFVLRWEFALRWFTPVCETALCGHATMAAAAALVAVGNKAETLRFKTRHSGWLTVKPRQRGDRVCQLQMSLPANVASRDAVPQWADKDSALIKELMSGHSDWVEDVQLSPHLRYLLVVLRQGVTRQQLESLQPDMLKLKAAANDEDGGLVGATVTCRDSEASNRVYSRFFAPWTGLAEDPVTGSAHGFQKHNADFQKHTADFQKRTAEYQNATTASLNQLKADTHSIRQTGSVDAVGEIAEVRIAKALLREDAAATAVFEDAIRYCAGLPVGKELLQAATEAWDCAVDSDFCRWVPGSLQPLIKALNHIKVPSSSEDVSRPKVAQHRLFLLQRYADVRRKVPANAQVQQIIVLLEQPGFVVPMVRKIGRLFISHARSTHPSPAVVDGCEVSIVTELDAGFASA